MRLLLKGGLVCDDHGTFSPMDIEVTDGIVTGRSASFSENGEYDRVLDLTGLHVFPGLADVHVHLREPGFSYKETIATGTRACARGGYTTVCAMPNLNPAPDTSDHLKMQEDLIRDNACIRVLPYASITMEQKGEGDLTDMAALAGRVCGFSDDGRGVKEEATMRMAMEQCKAAGSIIAAHCEDMSLIPPGGAIHDGAFARTHGIPGIPSESEWGPIARDIALVRETGCPYHVCHVSTKESVALIRKAKAEGLDITCETGPHYLLMCQDDLQDEGRFKMNPPLRDKEDQQALIEGLLDGTIDMIATDHAPHSAEEKSRGLAKSAMGVVGIETAFPLMYTYFVKTGRMTLPQLIDRMSNAPRRRFRLDGGMNIGDRAEITAFDLDAPGVIDPEDFLSMGRATPFAGWEVSARCCLTISGDRIAYDALTQRKEEHC
ncbi:MAG: dihydroorotase [Clostridiales bacterium]|nr:dihydroorotase [Clostridiales bacterium]